MTKIAERQLLERYADRILNNTSGNIRAISKVLKELATEIRADEAHEVIEL